MEPRDVRLIRFQRSGGLTIRPGLGRVFRHCPLVFPTDHVLRLLVRIHQSACGKASLLASAAYEATSDNWASAEPLNRCMPIHKAARQAAVKR